MSQINFTASAGAATQRCSVCGAPAVKWWEPLGYIHVECAPLEAFDRWTTARRRLTLVPDLPPETEPETAAAHPTGKETPPEPGTPQKRLTVADILKRKHGTFPQQDG